MPNPSSLLLLAACWLLACAPALHAQVVFSDGFEPACAGDSDGDRLDDCDEMSVYGTDPDNPDSDGDGISDGDEVLGTTAGLDLPALGVDPLRRDVLLEVDWMVGPECGEGFSREPLDFHIAPLVAALASAPVDNPDGSQGIHLVVDYGQGAPLNGGNAIDEGDAVLEGGLEDGSGFRLAKAAHFDEQRLGYFRYAILAWRYSSEFNTSSGMAEVEGDDLIVAMGCTFASNEGELGAISTSNVLLHELGHVLGLRHGGPDACNHKPNYNSVMNYQFTFYGIDDDCDALPDYDIGDYSMGLRVTLDETSLDEQQGVCGSVAVDWNASGDIEAGISEDLNSEDANQAVACGGELTVLEDHDDWATLESRVGTGLPPASGQARALKLALPEIVTCDLLPLDLPVLPLP